MKTLLSLFDYSGQWSAPFADAGWSVVQVDIKHGHDIKKFSAKWLINNLLQGYPTIDGILAAPPCTCFTKSAAQYWPAMDADGRTAESVELVYQVLRCVDYLKPDFWALENPIGRLPKLVPELGKPLLTFDPCDYARWVAPTPEEVAELDTLRTRLASGGSFSKADIEIVRDIGAYTKRTQLWGKFSIPQQDPLEPVRVNSQGSWLQSLGGKSEKTKMLRSLTPEGFSLAFCAANAGGQLERKLMALDAAAMEIKADPPKGLSRAYVDGFLTRRLPDLRLQAW
jgi:hypothetical protein